MVTSNNEMRTSIVLAHERMEDGFTRTSIAHGGWQNPQNNAISRIIVFQQYFIAAHTYLGWNIIVFGDAHQRVQEQAIDGLKSTFLDVLMRPVHRIASLETDYAFPTALYKHLTRLSGS